MIRPFFYVHAFIWTFIATAVLTSGMVLARGVWPTAPVLRVGLFEVLAYGGTTLLLLRFHAPNASPRKLCGLRPTHPALFALGIALGAALQGPAETLRLLSEHYVPASEQELLERSALLSPTSVQSQLLITLVLACVGPLLEEVFFRGAVYGALRRYNGPGVAASISGLCFVVGHTNPRIWLSLACVAAILSYLRAVSGSVMPSLAVHVTFNSITLGLAAAGTWDPKRPALGTWWLVSGWVISVVLLLLVARVSQRSRRAESARLEDLDD